MGGGRGRVGGGIGWGRWGGGGGEGGGEGGGWGGEGGGGVRGVGGEEWGGWRWEVWVEVVFWSLVCLCSLALVKQVMLTYLSGLGCPYANSAVCVCVFV